jgi:signal recognition particle subunit SRP54
MQMVRKMGPLSKVFGMLPGMGDLKDRIAGIDERDVDHIEAIIHSMTPTERENPKIIDGSRRARIARGAGVEVSEVNTLINRFFEARKMMSSLATGSMPGVPGIGGLTGPRRQPTRSQKKKGGRGVSGNPAKRNAAQQPAAAVDPAAAFGGGEFDQAALEKAMADFQLPPELRSRFGK